MHQHIGPNQRMYVCILHDTFCKLMKSVSNFMFGGMRFHIFGPKDFKLFVYNVHSSFKALHHDVI